MKINPIIDPYNGQKNRATILLPLAIAGSEKTALLHILNQNRINTKIKTDPIVDLHNGERKHASIFWPAIVGMETNVNSNILIPSRIRIEIKIELHHTNPIIDPHNGK